MTATRAKPIPGQPSSDEILQRLKDAGKPVLLAFSCGKDSTAAWIALRDAGVEVVPYYLYLIPDMEFVQQGVRAFEEHFGQRIRQYPHPSLVRILNNMVNMPPEYWPVISAARLPSSYDYAWLNNHLRDELNLPGAWVADGVRASDSPQRRFSFQRHGVMKQKDRKVSVVWDWLVAEVRDRIREDGAPVPIDYKWFDRSFDGLDDRFIRPIRDNAPRDYQKILEWFPLSDLDIYRWDHFLSKER